MWTHFPPTKPYIFPRGAIINSFFPSHGNYDPQYKQSVFKRFQLNNTKQKICFG